MIHRPGQLMHYSYKNSVKNGFYALIKIEGNYMYCCKLIKEDILLVQNSKYILTSFKYWGDKALSYSEIRIKLNNNLIPNL